MFKRPQSIAENSEKCLITKDQTLLTFKYCLFLTLLPPAPQSSGWHQFHTWFSTEPLQSLPWTYYAVAQPWLLAPPHIAPSADQHHDEQTELHGPGHS